MSLVDYIKNRNETTKNRFDKLWDLVNNTECACIGFSNELCLKHKIEYNLINISDHIHELYHEYIEKAEDE